MKNLSDTEILKTFEERRPIFRPYGLTCEKWAPRPMGKYDRHNEIELNLVPDGCLSYVFHDRMMSVPAGRLTIFWGLIPHRVAGDDGVEYYYVATIPLSVFLKWNLPAGFVKNVLNGGMYSDSSDTMGAIDAMMFDRWCDDLLSERVDPVGLELQARMLRLSENYVECGVGEGMRHSDVGKIADIAMYIARNYNRSLRISDFGCAVGLNADYANSVFKRAFGHTLLEHVMLERITHAQRQLITTADSVLQIAYDCGFGSVSRFNVTFRKINGCTPREYRYRHSS